MLIQLTELEARVVGVLLEKEKTTPDQYPLTLNSITTACNQKSNRDPVMALNEGEVQRTIDDLTQKNLLLEVSGSGARVQKYKHRFCNTEFNSLKFSEQQKAIICVMLLRGPQTPGELRTRTNRLAEFANVNEVERALESLADHNGERIVVRLEREPGKRESRYAHLFCGEPTSAATLQSVDGGLNADSPSFHQRGTDEKDQRIAQLENDVIALRHDLEKIKSELGLP
ncbi:DUF480 domain-containing protein [Glaciecola sp. MH2013]|uniref:YceH family protein n=1 Tax=Glaciecola sp. MH2013 TaxID=2785524 RepID=UPI00189EF2C8|nr:DUF480 domain-containing protein [Glaciecola sp. MH2013]MBF7073392.1 DUF480 domain-containing protein [Glaciecola sp. MH2013]